MLMGQPPCPLMKGKRALGNSMVQYNCFLQLFHAFIFFDWFVHYVSIFHYFLAAVIYPSLAQLHEGINEVEDRKQKAICIERYRRREEDHKRVISEIDDNIEEECGICMEINNKVVLPTCSHAMCIKCYRDWRSRSQSCPFCRDSLKRVNSADLWIYTDNRDIVDMATVRRENLRRLFMYIDKLPTVIPESVFEVYDSHVK
ncbi:hypothetical protein VPH35_027298 [Triticum aestivum]